MNAEFVSETARIDLNSAPKELLSGLFTGLGAPRGQADDYADRILGWRTPPAAGQLSSEAANYRTAGTAIRAARRPVPEHRRAFALVLGIPDLMVERALPVPDRL